MAHGWLGKAQEPFKVTGTDPVGEGTVARFRPMEKGNDLQPSGIGKGFQCRSMIHLSII